MSLEHSQALERNWERKKPLLQWHAGISPWESWTPRKSLSSIGIRKKAFESSKGSEFLAILFSRELPKHFSLYLFTLSLQTFLISQII